jgi:hypothetical protein
MHQSLVAGEENDGWGSDLEPFGMFLLFFFSTKFLLMFISIRFIYYHKWRTTPPRRCAT